MDKPAGFNADKALGILVSWVGVGCLLCAPTAFILMCVTWLKTAVWPTWSLHTFGLSAPTTNHLGLNKILTWTYDLQIAWLLLFCGVVLAWFGNAVAED